MEVHCTVQCAFLYVFNCLQSNGHQHTARKLAEDNEEPELGHLLEDGLMRWSDLLAQRVERNLTLLLKWCTLYLFKQKKKIKNGETNGILRDHEILFLLFIMHSQHLAHCLALRKDLLNERE